MSIPLPQIDMPALPLRRRARAAAWARGAGRWATPSARASRATTDQGKAGDRIPGEHVLEVELSLDELAEILGEELQLPRIEPKGKERIITQKDKYVGIRRTGPESLRHFKRTFREALRRQIMIGHLRPEAPDDRPRSARTGATGRGRPIPLPQSNAVIIYMMDVSGSMGDEQKEIVRIESFWIDTWLRSQYKGLESRYIIHDAVAKEVDRDTFFRTRESGGTMISSAYKLCAKMIEADFPPSEWNIYPFHFSDGDNWSVDDTVLCIELMKNEILPKVNLFCYGQVESPYGSGQFIKDLNEHFDEDDSVVCSEIKDKEGDHGSDPDFLGKGK